MRAIKGDDARFWPFHPSIIDPRDKYVDAIGDDAPATVMVARPRCRRHGGWPAMPACRSPPAAAFFTAREGKDDTDGHDDVSPTESFYGRHGARPGQACQELAQAATKEHDDAAHSKNYAVRSYRHYWPSTIQP